MRATGSQPLTRIVQPPFCHSRSLTSRSTYLRLSAAWAAVGGRMRVLCVKVVPSWRTRAIPSSTLPPVARTRAW